MKDNMKDKKIAIFVLTMIVFMMIIVVGNQRHRHNPIQPKIQEPTTKEPAKERPKIKKPVFTLIIKEGGQDLEDYGRRETISQLGMVSEGTIIHEGTHFVNAILNSRIGGDSLIQPSDGFCAFYLWGENKYLVMPTAGFAKREVIDLIPTDCVNMYNFNNYFGSMFASRDANHIIEDFVAELNGFEEYSPALLRDMLIFSIALGLKMEQKNVDLSRLRQYQGGNKFLIERSIKKNIDLSIFVSSTNPKAVALKNYLIRTYGENLIK